MGSASLGEQLAVFPQTGSRARRFARFERDLEAWLATPGGRFARWRAASAVADASSLAGPRMAHRDDGRAEITPADVG